MRPLPRVGMVATVVAIALIALPATAFADCTPACGDEVEQGLDAFSVLFLIGMLTVFVAVMTLGGRFVRKDRGPSD